jgi:16S rRNA (guanine527-N7)-methyltransferase
VTRDVLERWLEEVVRTPGATAFEDADTARRVLLDDALRAVPLLEDNAGPVVDVGSGGGSPGIPLAVSLLQLDFTLLEAERRKCAFLETFARELPNVAVVWGRAEEQPLETYGIALAKALAKPPVAVELCAPLVSRGGMVVLWLGETADREQVVRAAGLLGCRLEADSHGLAVLRKVDATPAGFPRRTGVAKKRPLV